MLAVPRRSSARARRCAALAVAASAVALGTAPAASATVWRGATDDPRDDVPGVQDLLRVEAAYDDGAGTLTGRVTLREAPGTQDDIVAVAFGRRTGGGECGSPSGAVGGTTGSALPTAVWSRTDAAGTRTHDGRDGTRVQAGAVITYTATAAPLVAQGYTCVVVGLRPVAGTAAFDATGTFDLAADPGAPPSAPPDASPLPAPAPMTPPAGAPPATPPTGTGKAPRPPRPARKAPALEVVAPTVRTVKRGRWTTLRVRVRNRGTAQARNVRLAVGSAKGVGVRGRTATWRRLKAGRSAATTVRVRLTGKAAARSLTVRVRGAGRLRAATTIALRTRRPAPKKRAPAAPAAPQAPAGPLAGRYFWGFRIQPAFAWDTYGVWFVDDEWAYYGFPPAGRPACSAPTEATDGQGRPTGGGCRRYAYDPVSGALTVGERQGTFRNGNLTLDGVVMAPLTIPEAGTRYAVELVHKGFSGLCGLGGGCTTWAEHLALAADGRFVRSTGSISSAGGVGTPLVWSATYPPNETGTYEVLDGGRIRFSYLDGTTREETIGVGQRDGAPDPAGEGIVIGETNFYPPVE